MRSNRWIVVCAVLAMISALPKIGLAQVTQVRNADSIITMLSASKRAGVTRAELQASLVEIERVTSSTGYSGAMKTIKQAEAMLIRQRLAEGDIRPGDVVTVGVVNDAAITGNYTVTPARTIIIPSIGTIPVDGILRSEVPAHMQKQLSRFLRDPVVLAEALIRIGIFGGVGKQGYPVVSAGLPLSEVLMTAGGGIAGNADMKRSVIKRADREIVSSEAFTLALREGHSLDQLNMQAGDEIYVGLTTQTTLKRVVAVVSGAASLAFLLVQVF